MPDRPDPEISVLADMICDLLLSRAFSAGAQLAIEEHRLPTSSLMVPFAEQMKDRAPSIVIVLIAQIDQAREARTMSPSWLRAVIREAGTSLGRDSMQAALGKGGPDATNQN